MWISSSEQAIGINPGAGCPTASAAAMAKIGRTRFPPAMRLYRMLSWSVVGAVVALGMTESRNRSTSSRFCSR